MATPEERIGQLEASVAKAVDTVQHDRGASPVLVAVVKELERKAAKAQGAIGGGEVAVREAIVEVEQAADSAKAAVEADAGVEERTKAVILAAHDLVCVTKIRMTPPIAGAG